MIPVYIGLGVGVALAILVLVISGRKWKQRDIQAIYTEGLDHLLNRDLKRAYECFKAVIDQNTDHISAYLKLGQVIREKGAAASALKLHESLLARPTLSSYHRLELHKNLALDHYQLRDFTRAVESTRTILKMDKKHPWAHLHLIKIFRKQGDWASTGKALEQWQKINGRVDKHLQAYCRFRQGFDLGTGAKPEIAREYYTQALKIDPNFTPAYYYLGQSYGDEVRKMMDGRTSLAADEKENGRKKGGKEREIRKLYSQAVSHWIKFAERSPGDIYMILPQLEEALFYLRRFDDLEPFLRQVLEKDEDNLDVVASLANFYERKGQIDEAEGLLHKISEDETSAPLIRMIKLKLKYRRNRAANLQSELDRLFNTVRLQASRQMSHREAHDSLMRWLEPDFDPLEGLA